MATTGSRCGAGLAVTLALGASLVFAPAVQAHPHIFIDTGLEIVFDEEGRLAAIQVVWVYDEFSSMIALDDYGLDQDYDGILTEDERAELAAIYSNWDPDYAGDLYAWRGGQALPLSGPIGISADVTDGRIVIVHFRAFLERVEMEQEPVIIRAYDPSYFTAYALAAEPAISGREDCVAEVSAPDLDAATERLMAVLDERAAAGESPLDIDEEFPEVGEDFAEEIRLLCAN